MESLSNQAELKNFIYSQSPEEQARHLENAAKEGDVDRIQKLFALNP